MKRAIALAALVTIVFLAVCLPAQAVTVIEKYSSPAAFKARLAGFPVKIVTFDAINTAAKDPVSFSATKYRTSSGMVIAGEGGQYASRSFRSPGDFVPVSVRNMYAPGPITWTGVAPIGGNETVVTFVAGAGSILAAAGFGCSFIDADFPSDGPAGFTVYDGAYALLGDTGTVITANAKHAFVGLVAVDSVTGKPVPAISRVHIVNGSGWPGNDDNEGVALDDFMVGTATYSVSGKVVRRSGAPVKGATVTLRGGFALTSKTNAKGRFTIANVPPGTYTLRPKKSGLTFLPVKRSVVVVAKNVALAGFVGTP